MGRGGGEKASAGVEGLGGGKAQRDASARCEAKQRAYKGGSRRVTARKQKKCDKCGRESRRHRA